MHTHVFYINDTCRKFGVQQCFEKTAINSHKLKICKDNFHLSCTIFKQTHILGNFYFENFYEECQLKV